MQDLIMLAIASELLTSPTLCFKIDIKQRFGQINGVTCNDDNSIVIKLAFHAVTALFYVQFESLISKKISKRNHIDSLYKYCKFFIVLFLVKDPKSLHCHS